MPLLGSGRNLGYSSFIHLPYANGGGFLLLRGCALIFEVPPRSFLQSRVIKPYIVIAAVVRQLLFILDPTLP